MAVGWKIYYILIKYYKSIDYIDITKIDLFPVVQNYPLVPYFFSFLTSFSKLSKSAFCFAISAETVPDTCQEFIKVVADTDDNIEVVVCNAAFYFPVSFVLNCCKKRNS